MLKKILFDHIKSQYPRAISNVEIEIIARKNGYSGSTGSRKARCLTEIKPNKPIPKVERLYQTIQHKGRGVRVVNYKYKPIIKQENYGKNYTQTNNGGHKKSHRHQQANV